MPSTLMRNVDVWEDDGTFSSPRPILRSTLASAHALEGDGDDAAPPSDATIPPQLAPAADATPPAPPEDEEEDESVETAMGFMFDSSHARATVTFTPPGCTAPIRLRLIKGDPGHVQSGQYLWPAAQHAAGWLLSSPQAQPWLQPEGSGHCRLGVVELGAGCGLAGLALAQRAHVSAVVLTDYDYGSLELLRENAALATAGSSDSDSDSDGSGKTVIVVEKLKWGPAALPPLIVSTVASVGALVVVGTDLVYSRDVVLPLLQTVRLLLALVTDGLPRSFILFSSFDISAYDDEVARACAELTLEKREIEPLDETNKRSRIQVFSLAV